MLKKDQITIFAYILSISSLRLDHSLNDPSRKIRQLDFSVTNHELFPREREKMEKTRKESENRVHEWTDEEKSRKKKVGVFGSAFGLCFWRIEAINFHSTISAVSGRLGRWVGGPEIGGR